MNLPAANLHIIQSYDDRVDAILDWLSEKSYHSVSIFQLNDSFGPAPVMSQQMLLLPLQKQLVIAKKLIE